MNAYALYVGIDMAAASATATWQRVGQTITKPHTIEQNVEGFVALHRALAATGVAPDQTLLVLEATGSYWLALATFFVRQGYHVSVINALQAHHFAKALLKRAKTDAIDAHTLTQLAMMLHPKPWTPPPAIYEELQQRLAQRDTLLGIRNQLTNQRHELQQSPVAVPSVVKRLDDLAATLTTEIATLDTELSKIIELDEAPVDEWTATIRRLQTIPGVGLQTALWLVVTTLNFTIGESVEQLVAYAGLAPMPYQSGTSVNKRPGIGRSGNARLRTALYLATLSGACFNPLLQPFYDRLISQGKPKKVARCAVARKLLHLAWAIGTKHTTFDPLHQTRVA